MTDDTPLPFDLPAVSRRKITMDFNGGTQSSDAGLLLLREAGRRLGACRRLPERCGTAVTLTASSMRLFEMVMARSSAIAGGYKDAIDHNIAGRRAMN
jgi:hypothetical protein